LPIGILRGEISLNFEEKPPEGSKETYREVNMPAWLQRHSHDHVSSLLSDLTENLKRQDPGLSLFGVGYCFGGKHVLRLAKSTLKAAAAFHPSFVEPADLTGIQVPLYIGLAEKDEMVPETLEQDFKNWSMTILQPGVAFSLEIYSGMGHGFAARPDTEDEDIRREYTKAFDAALDFLTKYER
jgi:dienelactone hydrolase